jgi:tetratricopeptide (TPR) repeat protein
MQAKSMVAKETPRIQTSSDRSWKVHRWTVTLLVTCAVTLLGSAAWRLRVTFRGESLERERALQTAANHDQAAIPELVKLFNKDPADIPVIRALTTLSMVADAPDDTLLWLDRWHVATPQDLRPMRLALEVASRAGRFDAVLHWSEKLLAIDPDTVPILERLVSAELTLGQSADALRHARELLERGGVTDSRTLLLARSLFFCGRDAEAINVLEPLCSRDPPDVVAIALCADFLAKQEGLTQVISKLRAALEGAFSSPSAQMARFELARLLHQQGDRAEAETVMEEWERFEAADATARNAYQRPSDKALTRKAADLLTATGQTDASASLLADLAMPVRTGKIKALTPAPRTTSPLRSAADPDTPHNGFQETMGSGLAWIDYDRDGHSDLFCVQVTTTSTPKPGHRLYRNLGEGTFIDVTESTGVGLAAYGMGVEVGDIDNDGYDDLVVSDLSGLTLLHNVPHEDGHRTFVDITAEAGLVNPHWATGVAFLDVDADGRLDLYVTNYVTLDPLDPRACVDPRTGLAQPCSPTAYEPTQDRIFRNTGSLRFEDMTAAWGLDDLPAAAGLGVLAVDLNQDNHCDLFVANDMHAAFYLRNTGSGFVEEGLLAGCSHGPKGRLMAGMGIIAADVDRSGFPSLVLTNFHFEPNVLFRAVGEGTFVDHTYASGLGGPSHASLGFGVVCLDANLDGSPDIAIANGHVNRSAQRISSAPCAQPMQLFLGDGRGTFRDVSATAGGAFRLSRIGRGLAACDFDNDGRSDLAVTENGGQLALLRNTFTSRPHWIQLLLEGDGTSSNRSAIGAKVEVHAATGKQTHFICGGGSYLSASDRCLTIGLGEKTDDVCVTVTWPSGRRQDFGPLRPNTRWRLIDGQRAKPIFQSLLDRPKDHTQATKGPDNQPAHSR